MKKTLELPIEIAIYDKAYHKAVEEYNDKMEEYYAEKEKYSEDDVFAKIHAESLEKPILPEPKIGTSILKFKVDLLIGYEIAEDKVYLLLDGSKVVTEHPNYYITKKDDKIIEELDKILENN